MNQMFPKHGRVRLQSIAYGQLRKEILTRDGWRCQICGCGRDLQVHHVVSRGRLGNDCEENLITLCSSCHRRIHGNACASY